MRSGTASRMYASGAIRFVILEFGRLPTVFRGNVAQGLPCLRPAPGWPGEELRVSDHRGQIGLYPLTGGRAQNGNGDFAGQALGPNVGKTAAISQPLHVAEVKGLVESFPQRQQRAVEDGGRRRETDEEVAGLHGSMVVSGQVAGSSYPTAHTGGGATRMIGSQWGSGMRLGRPGGRPTGRMKMIG